MRDELDLHPDPVHDQVVVGITQRQDLRAGSERRHHVRHFVGRVAQQQLPERTALTEWTILQSLSKWTTTRQSEAHPQVLVGVRAKLTDQVVDVAVPEELPQWTEARRKRFLERVQITDRERCGAARSRC